MTDTAPHSHARQEDELQAITAQMVKLVAEHQHLLCAQLAPPQQAALCDRLASALPQCFVLRVMIAAPGRLLAGVLAAIGIGGFSDDTSGPRRDLALRLSSAQQRGQAIVLLLGGAEHLNDEDAALLLHFFPAGATSVVLIGAGSAADWAPCRQALAAGAKVHACVYRDVGATARAPERIAPIRHGASAAEAPTDPARESPPADAAAPPPLLNVRVEPRASADGGPPRQGRTQRRLERRLRRWRSLALLEAVLVIGLAALLIEPRLRPPDSERSSPPTTAPREAPPAVVPPPPVSDTAQSMPPAQDGPEARVDDEPTAALTERATAPATSSAEPSSPASTPAAMQAADEPPPTVAPPPVANDRPRENRTPAVDTSREPTAPAPNAGANPPRRAPEGEAVTSSAEMPAPSLEAMQEAERYAERAEGELHRGQLAAAATSISRGLSLDPRNLRLLDLQVVMRSARSPNAPPLPGAP